MPLTYEAVLFEASALSATSFAAAFASASLPSRSSHPRYTSTDRVTHVALLSSTSFSVAAVIFFDLTFSSAPILALSVTSWASMAALLADFAASSVLI